MRFPLRKLYILLQWKDYLKVGFSGNKWLILGAQTFPCLLKLNYIYKCMVILLIQEALAECHEVLGEEILDLVIVYPLSVPYTLSVVHRTKSSLRECC